MKAKLSGLFGKAKSEDLSFDVYRSFIHHYKFKGLDSVLAVSKFFSQLKKVDVEKKKIVDGPVELPVKIFFTLISGSRLIPQEALELNTLRDLMGRGFVLFDDDVVQVRLGRGEEIILDKTGPLKDLKFFTTDITSHNFPPGTLLVLNVKLLEPSALRSVEEERCLYGNYEAALEKARATELHKKILETLPEELLEKRLGIYGVSKAEEIKGTDFGSRDLQKIVKILEQMKNPYLSNEALLSQEPAREKAELDKMRQWLTRNLGNDPS